MAQLMWRLSEMKGSFPNLLGADGTPYYLLVADVGSKTYRIYVQEDHTARTEYDTGSEVQAVFPSDQTKVLCGYTSTSNVYRLDRVANPSDSYTYENVFEAMAAAEQHWLAWGPR